VAELVALVEEQIGRLRDELAAAPAG
jgi:hypothetical protein